MRKKHEERAGSPVHHSFTHTKTKNGETAWSTRRELKVWIFFADSQVENVVSFAPSHFDSPLHLKCVKPRYLTVTIKHIPTVFRFVRCFNMFQSQLKRTFQIIGIKWHQDASLRLQRSLAHSAPPRNGKRMQSCSICSMLKKHAKSPKS